MLRKETELANELLRKRKQDVLSIESILETRHAMKRYSPEALGQGNARSGGVAARRLRYEVLDKWPSWALALLRPRRMIGRGSARHGMRRCVTSMRRNGAVHSVNGCKQS